MSPDVFAGGARQSMVVPITETSQVAEARRVATEAARRLGCDASQAEKVALIVTEVGTNLVKHAGGGEVLLGTVGAESAAPAMHITAVDKGHGMRNAAECLRDGYSTSGSAGTGLGAIRRLSDRFDLYSQPERGSVVWAELRPYRDEPGSAAMEVGAVCRSKIGEEACGDGWAVRRHQGRWRFLVADGLGHGLHAAEAALEASRLFEAHHLKPLPTVLETIHLGLRATRGAAVAVADLDVGRSVVQFVGVGNISAVITNGETVRNLVSLSGTAGVEIRKVTEFSYPWPDGAALILHSDGLGTHWKLADYPGLAQRHPAVIAATLYRDFNRGRDDVTIVVAKQAVQ
ncbi:ATP-binding protein [Candidatus Nitrospira bockiana]